MASTIKAVRGDITEQAVDAIVNAANNHLWMGAGVAGAIAGRGGRSIEAEAIRQGPIEIGSAVVTGAGSLAATHVIHAAAMGQDLATDAEKIRAATAGALRLGEEMGLHSIALPALGTGVGGFPPQECARIMVAVARERAGADEAIALIRFVLFDQRSYEAFQRALVEGG